MDKPLSTKPEECRYSFFQHTQCEFFPCHKTAKCGKAGTAVAEITFKG